MLPVVAASTATMPIMAATLPPSAPKTRAYQSELKVGRIKGALVGARESSLAGSMVRL